MSMMRTATPPVCEESPNNPAGLEHSGSQWAIKLPDGRIIPTGSSQERTERDAKWENNAPQGRGGCSAVVRDAYATPWRTVDDPAPVLAPDVEAAMAQAAEVADLHAQVARLADQMRYYRHLAAEHVETCPRPATHSRDRGSPRRRRLLPARSQSLATTQT